MRWEQGRADIDALIADGHIERVPASREHGTGSWSRLAGT